MAASESGHVGFTFGQQAFVERADIRVMADGDEGRPIQLAPHPGRAGFRQVRFIVHTGTRLMLGGDDAQIRDKLSAEANRWPCCNRATIRTDSTGPIPGIDSR